MKPRHKYTRLTFTKADLEERYAGNLEAAADDLYARLTLEAVSGRDLDLDLINDLMAMHDVVVSAIDAGRRP